MDTVESLILVTWRENSLTGDGCIETCLEVSLEPEAAFRVFTEEIAGALRRHSLYLENRAGSMLLRGEHAEGYVREWHKGEGLLFEVLTANWVKDGKTTPEFSFSPSGRGTLAGVSVYGLHELPGRDDQEFIGWFARNTAFQILNSLLLDRFRGLVCG